MKHTVQSADVREELIYLKRQIEIIESKISFTTEPRLLDALCYELLGLKSRMGYLIESAKSQYQL